MKKNEKEYGKVYCLATGKLIINEKGVKVGVFYSEKTVEIETYYQKVRSVQGKLKKSVAK